MICSCIYCRKEYSVKGIFTHVERTHFNSTKYSDGRNKSYNNPNFREKLKLSQKNRFDNKLGEITTFEVNCDKCSKRFQVLERESQFPKKEKYFCSRSCANSKIVSDAQKIKTSESLIGRKYVEPVEITSICVVCNTAFKYIKNQKLTTKIQIKKYCSTNCSKLLTKQKRRKHKSDFETYKLECAFKFNVYQYPDKFNLKLIEEFGWYKPKNKGNNLTGISRDHRISISYGFRNNIPANYISHPANCELMQHGYNSSKNIKCSITYEELLNRISKWNMK